MACSTATAGKLATCMQPAVQRCCLKPPEHLSWEPVIEAADQASHKLSTACSNSLLVKKQDGVASGQVHLIPMTYAIGNLTECKESVAE